MDEQIKPQLATEQISHPFHLISPTLDNKNNQFIEICKLLKILMQLIYDLRNLSGSIVLCYEMKLCLTNFEAK